MRTLKNTVYALTTGFTRLIKYQVDTGNLSKIDLEITSSELLGRLEHNMNTHRGFDQSIDGLKLFNSFIAYDSGIITSIYDKNSLLFKVHDFDGSMKSTYAHDHNYDNVVVRDFFRYTNDDDEFLFVLMLDNGHPQVNTFLINCSIE